MIDLLHTALESRAAGYSVIPIRPDGSKAPALSSWKRYSAELADIEQVRAWFTNDEHDLGVVQGAVSGGAELTEIEGRAAHHLPDLKALAHDSGLGDLWDTITTGWVEMSPSGGVHFHYRITDAPVPGNQKLARGADKLVLAETRGEGGQVVVAPSRHHASGQPWRRLIGGPATAPNLTLDQRDAFHAILRTLDVAPAPPAPAPASSAPRQPGDGITPGDDFEARTDWADILTPHGWTLVTQRGSTRYWLRPGKQRGQGLSATTGHADDRDRLFVFTSSTDFTPEVPYTKLGAFAVLEHCGDHNAAAKALYAAGFGQRAEERRPVADTFFDDLLTGTPTTQTGTRPGHTGTTTDLNGTTTWTGTTAPASATSSTASTAAGSAATPAVAVGDAPAPPTTSEPATYSLTDDGNALRLIDTHGRTVRYCPQRERWLTWEGYRWRWDAAGTIHELARGIARNLPTEDRAAERHRANSLSRRGLDAMVAVARTDQRTTTNIDQLDAKPYQLNTPGGVIDLRTGNLTPANPAALHTRSTTVAPDPTSTPTRWLAFLADTFAGDPELTTYVQRLLGVSLAGIVLEQLLPFAHGPGANGKTTLLGVVQRVIGIGDDGYSISAPAEMLLATHQQGHPTEIARLSGARMVVTSELEDGQRFAEARIKQLTGRDVISGRFMRQDWFSFVPTHTLWLLANHQPQVRAGGPAFWRRLRLLPFEHTVPAERRIPDLEDRLVDEEGPAILAWLIAGARDYFRLGLAEPASVLAATDAYAGDQDTVGRFVDDRCDIGEPSAQHMQVRTSELRQAYETWCRIEGEEAVSAKALTTTLRTRFGVLADRDRDGRFYSGIRLRDAMTGASTNVSQPIDTWFQDGLR